MINPITHGISSADLPGLMGMERQQINDSNKIFAEVRKPPFTSKLTIFDGYNSP